MKKLLLIWTQGWVRMEKRGLAEISKNKNSAGFWCTTQWKEEAKTTLHFRSEKTGLGLSTCLTHVRFNSQHVCTNKINNIKVHWQLKKKEPGRLSGCWFHEYTKEHKKRSKMVRRRGLCSALSSYQVIGRILLHCVLIESKKVPFRDYEMSPQKCHMLLFSLEFSFFLL